jgi:hypothetical protein
VRILCMKAPKFPYDVIAGNPRVALFLLDTLNSL